MISVISNSKLQTTVKYTFWGKVAGVNFIISVRFLLYLTQIFLPMNMVGNSVLGKLRMRKPNTKTTVPLDVVPERRTKQLNSYLVTISKYIAQFSRSFLHVVHSSEYLYPQLRVRSSRNSDSKV